MVLQVMESKHNYNPLTNEMLELHIKDASRMVVTFDDRSRTEEGCVLVKISQMILGHTAGSLNPDALARSSLSVFKVSILAGV